MSPINILLIIVGAYFTLKLCLFSTSFKKTHFFCLAVASSIFVLVHLFIGLQEAVTNSTFSWISEFVIEWGHVTILTLVLTSLAIFIRNSKPIFTQFSKLYIGIPILILVSYFLVKDTYALKEWLLTIYQGGAIFISLLIYSVLFYRNQNYLPVLGGICLLFFSYILYWFVPGIEELYSWVWKLSLMGGMILFIFGYQSLGKQIRPANNV